MVKKIAVMLTVFFLMSIMLPVYAYQVKVGESKLLKAGKQIVEQKNQESYGEQKNEESYGEQKDELSAGKNKLEDNEKVNREELRHENRLEKNKDENNKEGNRNELRKENRYEKKNKGVIRVNNVVINFDVPPVIKDGRTLVPIRAIANGFKANVEYDSTTSTVIITKGDITIKLDLANNEVYVNDKKLESDVSMQIIKDRTFVPLRLISEIFGAKVKYDDKTGDIDIEEENDNEENNNTVSESVYGSVYGDVYGNVNNIVNFEVK